jgi:hypothetical protein
MIIRIHYQPWVLAQFENDLYQGIALALPSNPEIRTALAAGACWLRRSG